MSDKLNDLNTKNFNLYANTTILFIGFFIILYLLKRENKNIRDENSYDWSKYNILSEMKFKNKKIDGKDKNKARIKDFSKGTGFIKDEHKFQVNQDEVKKKEIKFLNYEEADNLQDMINFAASINQNDKTQSAYPIESLYNQVLNRDSNTQSHIFTNDKANNTFADILKNIELDDETKISKILDYYPKILHMKNKNLSESTYVGLVELFMKNGFLNHASYFLCQMDRLKLKIPRSLLDLFVDYSISHKLFEAKEEITFKNTNYDIDKNVNKEQQFNKYDNYELQRDPDYAHYFSRRNHYKQRNDIQTIFSRLKVDAKPFYPKNVEEEQYNKIKTKLSEINPSNVKEFIPKNYKVVKKEEI